MNNRTLKKKHDHSEENRSPKFIAIQGKVINSNVSINQNGVKQAIYFDHFGNANYLSDSDQSDTSDDENSEGMFNAMNATNFSSMSQTIIFFGNKKNIILEQENQTKLTSCCEYITKLLCGK